MDEFGKIYTEYFNDIYLYILRLSGDKTVAEEITSDTFFKAMRSIKKFRGECELRVWLCQIAKNCYFSHYKKAYKTEELNEEIADTSAPPDELVADKDQAAQIRKELHFLPEPYKEVFMWRIFAQLSFKQIGTIFNKSENWACVTYHRARKMIIERLEKRENGKHM